MKSVKKGKEEKQSRILLIICILLILISIISLTIYFSKRPYDTKVFKVSFIAGNNVGFDLNKTELKFGMVIPGLKAQRKITVDNTNDFPLYGQVFISNNLANIIIAEQNFTVQPKNKTEVAFTLFVPVDIKPGNYSGFVKLELRK